MVNRKIAMSAVSILAAIALMGGTTFAFFTDQASSTNNTFSTGNADLDIAPDTGTGPGGFAETISGPNFTGIIPGETRNFDFWLRNNSSTALGLDLLADISAINPVLDADQEIDNVLLISWNCDTDLDLSLGNNTPTSEFSPRDWLNGGDESVGSLASGTQMFCRMIGRLPSTADNTVAGETVVFDAVYNASQTP